MLNLKADKKKIASFYSRFFLTLSFFTAAVALALPLVALAQSGTQSIQELLYWFQLKLWTYWVFFFLSFASFFFFWGVVLFILNAGNEEKRTSGKQKMLWGIIALFVIFSVWGIIAILQSAFFGSFLPSSLPQ